ncbi:Microtubule-associated protein SPIRAL2-like [Apostasia shenzhenica]|uniref:Microtubule-associated protein SPIRAL2-like n=1 Tax=Apostasia shenzhenica TaxID=1088818 RepID=A0A2I0A7D7_9ASPA|nr:Microtubule-associated protein SPIRAL2-like [Apostasia shenzhenica]
MGKQQHPPEEMRQRVNLFMSKLSDRDTEAIAIAELESIARGLTADAVPSFVSAVGDTRTSDKTPLRRNSLRLFSVLARSLPAGTLAPHLHRILSAALRRLRDPDSSVRSALIDAVRSLAAAAPPNAIASALLRPLSEALFHEQDLHPQSAAAFALSAALEEPNAATASDLPGYLHRLVPRLVKLARSPAFKAKPAILTLLGSAASAGGTGGHGVLTTLVHCLVEFTGSEDWAARKAAAESLTRLAAIERDRLSDETETATEGRFPSASIRICSSVQSSSPSITRKSRLSISRSPPPAVSPSVMVLASSNKTNQSKNHDWGIEIAVPGAAGSKERARKKSWEQEEAEGNGIRSRLEAKRGIFDKICEEKMSGMKSGSRVVPFQESGSSEVAAVTGGAGDVLLGLQKENGDLSLIRMKLAQIESQQSTLLDLLQRFIGSSQNGIHSLETRVHSLEIALDEISRDLAASSGRMPGSDPSAKTCCHLPGTEFLSSKFWRRTEGNRFDIRFLAHTHDFGHRNIPADYKPKFGARGGFMNPLAEINPNSRASSKMHENAAYDTGIKLVQDA